MDMSEDREVQALGMLTLARHHLNLAADIISQAHDALRCKGAKSSIKMLQRGYDKAEDAINGRVSDRARAKFGMAMAELEARERGYDDSQAEGAGVSRPDGAQRDEGAESQDGGAPAGLGGDRTDPRASDGPGEAPDGTEGSAAERQGEG